MNLKDEKYEAVIGLEIHAQLNTNSKAFCGDEVRYGEQANSLISPVSLGHPGTLPVHNRRAIEMSIVLGLACNSEIRRVNSYSRKNYFYADLPKGYQITQFDTPICNGGEVEIEVNGQHKTVHLTRIHMEEDTGKSMHDLDIENSLVDYNRAGTPLVEIVTEPDIRSGDEAYAFLNEVRRLVRYLDICDGNMEEGSLRCDANVSIRPIGQEAFGTKVEVKNMNSMSNVKKAIEHEFARQVALVESGQEVQPETRKFDAMNASTTAMRSKEMVNDYRYFPEPDLPPLIVEKEWVQELREKMPALPKELYNQFTQEKGLNDYDAQVLTDDKEVADYFLSLCEHTNNYKAAANWIMGAVKSWVNNQASHITAFPIAPKGIADIIRNIDEGIISYSAAEQQLFPALLEQPKENVDDLIQALNLAQEGDDDFLIELIEQVLKEHPDKVEAYKSGKHGLLGMFMGQIMKRSAGKADPKKTNQLLVKALSN